MFCETAPLNESTAIQQSRSDVVRAAVGALFLTFPPQLARKKGRDHSDVSAEGGVAGVSFGGSVLLNQPLQARSDYYGTPFAHSLQ